jgi:hypothetical protein
LAGAAIVAAACGAATAEQTTPTSGTLGGVGVLPGAVGTNPSSVDTTEVSTTASTAPGEALVAPGNRVLVIGDSILASTSRRYTNDMCEALEPLGWRVRVEAESGRPIDFADTVLDRIGDDTFDVAVVNLGNNYDGDAQRYRERLAELVARIAPRPVVVMKITEFEQSRRQVNDVITIIEVQNDNVVVADWAALTVDGEFTGADGLHLTDAGRVAISELVADTLGRAPEEPGDCLSSTFQDDSAGSVDGGGAGSGNSTATTRPRSNATTTTTRASRTTVPRSTVPRTTTTTPPTPPTTVAPPTTPQPTKPKPTDPPPTEPPPTEPPPDT